MPLRRSRKRDSGFGWFSCVASVYPHNHSRGVWIYGRFICLPQLEELYVTASVDEESGEVILKTVNLTGEVKNVNVDLGIENMLGEMRKLQIGTLSGYSLTAENSLDAPDVVVPCYETKMVSAGTFAYDFPPHSVTVMVCKNR